ncbi:MAG: hypothetical protein ACK5JM_15255 [Rhodoblastus sp.]
MSIRFAAYAPALAFCGFVMVGPAYAQANVMQECGKEYQAAKAANSLAGKSWNDYLRECRVRHGGDTATAPAAAPVAKPAAAETKPATTKTEPATTKTEPAATKTEPAAAKVKPAASGPAVFPAGIDPKYANEKPAKQRMKTCLDQYNANKAGNGNGGLTWIQKGGGYYSECNKRLKG